MIIGGGPAGAAAAITLGRAGHRPVLLERASGPMDKVCGDFLGADTIERARGLGVDPAALGAAPIRRVRLIHGDRIAEARLPFLAMSLSRRVLDAALLRQAAEAGAAVRRGCLVRQVTPCGRRWTVRLAGRPEMTAETVFLATGKHDVRDLPRPGAAGGAVGMKMYFALLPAAARALEGSTELALFAGGYAGLQPVEAGRAVLCVAIQRRAFQRAGGGWPGLLALIERAAPCWAEVLGGATPLLPRPLAVAGIPYGMLAGWAGPDGVFRLGDQVAVIPSLTGDGMAIALHSGVRAAEVWMSGGDAMAYEQGLALELGGQMRLARAVAPGLHGRASSSSVGARSGVVSRFASARRAWHPDRRATAACLK